MKLNWFLGAFLISLVSLPAAVWAQSAKTEGQNTGRVSPSFAPTDPFPNLTVSLVNPSFSNEQCRVTNDSYSGINDFANQFDMGGADQGITVDDTFHRATWVFFGDAVGDDGNAWYGSNGSNAQGYLDGTNYANPLGLCGSLELVTEPGLVSSYTNPANGQPGMVFAPDLLTAPPGDSITNYLFHSPPAPASLPNNPTVLPQFSPTTSGISGTNESLSGAFAYNGSIYLFYFGSPGRDINSDCTIGLPRGSVSYLAVWKNPIGRMEWNPGPPPHQPLLPNPTDYNIFSRVDYNLDNFTYNGCLYTVGSTTCTPPWQTGAGHSCSASHPPSGYTSPPVPGDWQSPYASGGPMGGNFIWISPVVGNDGYLYLFGTGTFRASFVYLARLPLTHHGQDFPNFVTPYFADTPGLEFYNTNTGTWALNDPTNATPFVFDDDNTADLGQISVRYFDSIGVWLMMYSHSLGGGHGAEVVIRWAAAPTGPWSDMLIALDLTNTTVAGLANQSLYGCNGVTMSCKTAPPTEQQAPFTDLSAADVYAPDMLPYLGNVTPVFGAHRLPTGFNFTVYYLLSTFIPYNSVLFSVDMNVQDQFPWAGWP